MPNLAEKDFHTSLATISRYFSGKLITSKLCESHQLNEILNAQQKSGSTTLSKLCKMGYLFLVCTTSTSADSTFGCIGLTGDQRKVKEHIALLMDKEDAIFPCAWLSVSAEWFFQKYQKERLTKQNFKNLLLNWTPKHKVLIMDNCRIHYSVNATI